jgi:hypothetical protein
MPDSLVMPTPASMSYATDLTSVRAESNCVSSTVQLMAGTGLKFVHANNKGRKGVEGDLEKSRKLVSDNSVRDNFN